MATTNFRTGKLQKELENRLNENKEQVQYSYGKGIRLQRSIHDLLVAFDLIDTDLFKSNDSRFELDYLVAWEEELEKLNE